MADFGCVQNAPAKGLQANPLQRGALAYQPPELLERGVLSPAADCYAFGVLLWEMLTAQARPSGSVLVACMACLTTDAVQMSEACNRRRHTSAFAVRRSGMETAFSIPCLHDRGSQMGVASHG